MLDRDPSSLPEFGVFRDEQPHWKNLGNYATFEEAGRAARVHAQQGCFECVVMSFREYRVIARFLPDGEKADDAWIGMPA